MPVAIASTAAITSAAITRAIAMGVRSVPGELGAEVTPATELVGPGEGEGEVEGEGVAADAVGSSEAAATIAGESLLDGADPGLGGVVGPSVGFAAESNCATTAVAAVGVKVHVDALPEHGPLDHPPKTDPPAAVAVSVTGCPDANATWQVAPHEIPWGLLLTEPEPPPDLTTETVTGLINAKPWLGSVTSLYTCLIPVTAVNQLQSDQQELLPVAPCCTQLTVTKLPLTTS
jgi:hypothetical protein